MPIDRYQVSLKAFLKDSEGKVLLLGNPLAEEGHGGYCDLPGGRIDEGELEIPIMEILAREIREELGEVKTEIDPRPIGLARAPLQSSAGTINVLYVLFQGKFLGGDIKISSEHQGFFWVKPEDLDVEKYFKPAYREAIKECVKRIYG